MLYTPRLHEFYENRVLRRGGIYWCLSRAGKLAARFLEEAITAKWTALLDLIYGSEEVPSRHLRIQSLFE